MGGGTDIWDLCSPGQTSPLPISVTQCGGFVQVVIHVSLLVPLSSPSGVTLFLLESPQAEPSRSRNSGSFKYILRLFSFVLCMHLCISVCEHRYVYRVWKSEDTLQHLVLIPS